MNRKTLRLVIVAHLCVALSATLAAADVYSDFNAFCAKTFGAEREPLLYEKFGRDLRLIDDGAWTHVSENSATLAWETNLPAASFIEYGETAQYGRRTESDERPFYLHIHHLTGLETGKAYHYRLVAVDERGNKLVSPDATVEARAAAGTIHIPGDLGAPPYRLDKAGATYVLTKDIVSPSTVFDVVAKNITLDLNGFTVTYHDDAAARDPKPASAGEGNQSEHGVTVGYNATGVRVFNGRIVEGRGADGVDMTWNGGSRFQPVYACEGDEIGGLVLEYSCAQAGGIRANVGRIHHNVVLDRGTVVINRHQGVDAIAPSKTSEVSRNLIKRCRQRGIAGGRDVRANETYVDSWATNSFGIFYWGGADSVVRDNRVFGTGYLAEGIGLNGPEANPVRNVRVTGNLLFMQAVAPQDRWKEYGEQSGAYGLRIHHSVQNCEFAQNLIIGYARDGGMTRGIWYSPYPAMKDLFIRNNIVKAVSEDERSEKWGAVVVCGCDGDPEDYPHTVFAMNRVISNFCNVRLSEEYGMGINAYFLRNTFERIGARANYRTLHVGYWTFPTTGTRFVDSVFQGGAGYDKEVWEGEGRRDITVGWYVRVKTAPGAHVTVTNKMGEKLQVPDADATGLAGVSLDEYTRSADPRDKVPLSAFYGPYAITVEKDGKTATRTVNVSKSMELDIQLP